MPQLPVGFNSADNAHTIGLNERGTLDALRQQGLVHKEGKDILLTGDELLAWAKVARRHVIWMAVIETWLNESR
ncbi:hypothetical protein P3W23_03535 [Luteibacter sp. PPL554]